MRIFFISILNILKEFWAIARYRAPPRHVMKMSVRAGTRLNAIIFIVIVILTEDPLSSGIMDMFFQKYRIMCLFPNKREFISLKFAQIINSTTHQILSVGGSSIP
jgi:hypothetical protein